MGEIKYKDDNGNVNPRLPLAGGRFADMMITDPDDGGDPRVIWLPSDVMVDVYNRLAKGGHKPKYSNVISMLSDMPNVQGYDPGAFIRKGKLQIGQAEPETPKAGLGIGVDAVDNWTAGAGNALMRGYNSTVSGILTEGGNLADATQRSMAFADAVKGKAGEGEVTDEYHEAAKAGLPMPDDPAAVLADLVAQRGPAPRAPMSIGFGGRGFYTPYEDPAKKDPRYLEAVENKKNAEGLVAGKKKYQDQINEQQRRREVGVDLFKNPPANDVNAEAQANNDLGWAALFSPKEYSPDPRLAGDEALSKIAKYARSLTPEQRAAMSDQQIQAKVDELLSGKVASDFASSAKAVGKREAAMDYWSPISPALQTYNKQGNGYSEVYDEHGVSGVANTMFQQLSESVPNTAATMAATTLATLASGPAAPVVGPAAMGLSTAVIGAGTNFNQAFGVWLGDQGIKLSDLADPSSEKYAAAQSKLMELANRDPALFVSQVKRIHDESTGRAVAEGVTAVALNKLGDALTGRFKGALPKALQQEGSLLWAGRSIPFRPVQTFRGGIYKKVLMPRAINGAIDTWWEATEEGLTEIIVSVAMGEDVDLKTALSSFMVGGLMGGASSFGAGRSNIDNPLQVIQEKAAAGESGLDEVAAEIEKNTGMPAARAKASIQRAAELLDQFETFAKRYPPSMRGYAWQYFMQGYKGSIDKLALGLQDKARATAKDKANALAALKEALELERLQAINPDNVPVSPLIPSLQSDIDRINQRYPAATGEGRYYPPIYSAPTSSRSDQGQ